MDKVEDEVETALVKEVDCIRDYQQKMKMLIELMVKQVEANNSAQKKIMVDLKNKVNETYPRFFLSMIVCREFLIKLTQFVSN